jgi:hypothetical protein
LRRSDNDEKTTIGLLQYEDDCGDDDWIVAFTRLQVFIPGEETINEVKGIQSYGSELMIVLHKISDYCIKIVALRRSSDNTTTI